MPGQVIIFRNGQFDIFLGGSCHLVTVLGFKTFLNLDLFFLISIKGLFPVLFYFWSVFLSLVASGLSCSNSVAVGLVARVIFQDQGSNSCPLHHKVDS